MAFGMSLHIGLNNLDVEAYGEQTVLAGCINDADAMQSLAAGKGFQTRRLVEDEATADEVIAAIADAADTLRSGDMYFVTYSGHGSHVADATDDETDGQDETWCLWDRMLIDDELSQLWSQFQPGVRILMLSDSCHSGTVARVMKAREVAKSVPMRDFYAPSRAKAMTTTPGKSNILKRAGATPPPEVGTSAFTPTQSKPPLSVAAEPRIPPAKPGEVTFRWLDPSARAHSIRKNGGLYGTVQRLVGRGVDDEIKASVILISGCQDNQLSADGDGNGLFTETLLRIWNDGAFNGDYKAFHRAILDEMPSTQSPNYYTSGEADPTFESQIPFTLTTSATNEPVSASLWVTGPASLDRSDDAPTFRVNPGPNSHFIFEITSEPHLFDTGNVTDGERTDENFYGSWSDSAHYSGIEYILPETVWERLKTNDRLYYRIGSINGSSGWDNYMVSTPDQQYDLAPSISVSGDAGGGVVDEGSEQPTSDMPSITGPENMTADDPAPSFTLDKAGAAYAIIEVTTDPALFADDGGRNDDTFYATWQDSDLITGDSWDMSEAVWSRLAPSGTIYYRMGTTTSESGWEDYKVTTDDSAPEQAPSISVSITRGAGLRVRERVPAYA